MSAALKFAALVVMVLPSSFLVVTKSPLIVSSSPRMVVPEELVKVRSSACNPEWIKAAAKTASEMVRVRRWGFLTKAGCDTELSKTAQVTIY